MKKIFIPFIVLGIFITSCNNDFDNNIDDIKISQGSADFSTFVALGDSYSAGFMDNSLYISGQEESPVNILANQLKLAGGNNFVQPLWPDDTGGVAQSTALKGKIRLVGFDSNSNPILQNDEAKVTDFRVNQTVNNLAVPGAKVGDLINTNYNNPLFRRFAKSSTTSVVDEALNNIPNSTFFSLFIGGNDVLGFALAGGDQTKAQITTKENFESSYSDIVKRFVLTNIERDDTRNNRNGVLTNIADINVLPFFNTIPTLRVFTDAQVNQLNAAYNTYNNAIQQAVLGKLISEAEANKRTINFKSGLPSGFIMLDETLTNIPNLPSIRQSTKDDLFLLTTRIALESGAGTNTFLQDEHVLIPSEVKQIKDATVAYNQIISSLANKYNLAYADLNPLMLIISNPRGFVVSGVSYSNKYISGGIFSLDGIHPTGKGYSLIANEMIIATNRKYNSNIPLTNINSYKGVLFP